MDEMETYRRRQAGKRASLTRLGVPNIRCHCGETDPICFEADHIERRSNSDVVWGLCCNCHRKRTARHNSEHPKVGLAPGDPFERMVHCLLGVCDYLTFIADHLRAMADFLMKLTGKDIDIED